jgi:pimeloyl-ACP methyl ester carboxylesterase
MTTRQTLVRANGCQLVVRQVGDGPPVLLIHGVGCHAAMWSPIEESWTSQHLVSFDPPGVGKSPARLRPTSISGFADLAAAVLDELGLDEVDVVGYSLGGTVAQALAHRAPDRVRRLVLVATAPGWGCVPGRWKSMVHLYTPLRFMSRTYYEHTIGVMAGGQARTDPAFVERHAIARLKEHPSLVGYYSQVLAAAAWSSLSWLSEITSPTLVVAGGDDPLLPPANSAILARRIPNARMHLFPDDGHLLLFDERSPAIQVIEEFLTATSVEESASWANADVVTSARELEAIQHTHRGMFPWGLASAAYRYLKSSDSTAVE